MKKVNLLLLGLALSGAATLCAAEEANTVRSLFDRKKQTAPQAPAPAQAATPAPAQAAAPAPAQRVAAAPAATKDACGKKKPKNHGKGWAKGHDKHC